MDAEKRLEELYIKLGEEYFKGYLTEHPDRESISELCKTIKPIYMDCKRQQREELAEKGLMVCDYCGNTLPIKSRFCNMCGRSLMDKEEMEESKDGKYIDETAVKKCIMCGEVLEDDAVFCPNCGHKNS